MENNQLALLMRIYSVPRKTKE